MNGIHTAIQINKIALGHTKDVGVFVKTDHSFRILVEVAASNTFFGWLLMFGEKARIIESQGLATEIRDYLEKVHGLYK